MNRLLVAVVVVVSSAAMGCMTLAFGSDAAVEIELAPREATARVFEAKRHEAEPWRSSSGEFIARRWQLEPVDLIEEVRGKGAVRLRRGPSYLIVVDFDSGGRRNRAVCPELVDRWWLSPLLGLGVGGLVDWASGAIWRYEDGDWISRDHEGTGPASCYRRLPWAERLDLLLAED